ncbi:MAG: hypothetical protein KC994_26850, partial [Candidatus Omnitrophica bacterium]|nr:hypothetical protein [Candidatus Omnitrophota bacterium]
FAKNAPGFGLLASALLAFNPMWLKYSHLVYLEVPCAFWVMASLYVFHESSFYARGKIARHQDFEMERYVLRPIPAFVSGSLMGFAIITKYLAVPWFFIVLVIWIFTWKKAFFEIRSLSYYVGGCLLSVSTWPVFLVAKGNLLDWWAQSFGRWGSFQSGQGGDPRTDWTPFQFIHEVSQESGPVYFYLSLLGLFAFAIVLGIQYSGMKIYIASMSETRKRSVNTTPWPLSYSIYSLLYFLTLLASPTKDPKFLVVGLPALMISIATVATAIDWYIGLTRVSPKWTVTGKVVVGILLFLLAFPIDLLGLDNTPLKKLYPTDHAYTNVALPHGEDYRPIAESIFLRTKPGEVIPVGRQGPIIGYLADRP